MTGGEQVGSIVFDEPEAGGSAAGAEELTAGPGGPRLSRRHLLLGAAGLAGAGAAAWWAAGPGDAPDPDAGRPQPVAVSGPQPSWSFRAPAAQAPERVVGPTVLPLVATEDELFLLTPETGAVAKRVAMPGGPDDTLLAAGDLLYQTRVGRFLAHGYGMTLQVANPSGLSPSWELLAVGGDVLYGATRGLKDGKLFALSMASGALLWTRPVVDRDGGYLKALETVRGRAVLVAHSTRDEVVGLDPETGERIWAAPADQGLSWRECGADDVYVASRATGIRSLSLRDGSANWTVEEQEARPLRPLAFGNTLFLLRDNGVVSCNDARDGGELWSRQLPFRLDARCRPVLVAGSLFVPGPVSGGVCALDERTGAVRWTFRDAEPGVQYWRVATDGRHLFLGHDRVLHGLAPA
ncbi:PQQ-binding-like beta-propeller repeat protein [Kitasatospora sp. NPDC051853]|uniref:outer membrane protein assembly factor BamB family protein n=1 Tax=Kitasatospora sp. NPDC051853 TaxID=3364058 RepID=UPI00378FCBC7